MSTATLDHYAAEIAKKLAAEKDALIRRCVTARLGRAEWNDADIIPRMTAIIRPHYPETTFALDGKPLITFWPPQSKMSEDGMKMEMSWSLQYKCHE